MKPSVYVETSVVRYPTGRPSRDVTVLGDQFSTRNWWGEARTRFELAASPRVVHEEGVGDLRRAHDISVRKLFAVTHSSNVSEVLLRRFTNSCALPQATAQGAGHIAIGVTNGVENLATWNLRHIANQPNASKINQVCRNVGFRPTSISTPRQLMEVEREVPDEPMVVAIREYRDSAAARFGNGAVAIIRNFRTLHDTSDRPSVRYPPHLLEPTSELGQFSVSHPNETTSSSTE